MEALNEMLQPYAIWLAGMFFLYQLGKIWDARTELLKSQHRELMYALERRGHL